MLDLPAAPRGPHGQAEFHVSLAVDLAVTLYLVMSAPLYEGFDSWVYLTHAALPPDLKDDMEVVLRLITNTAIFSQLPPDDPAHRSFSALIARAVGLGEECYQRFVKDSLALRARHGETRDGRQVAAPPLHDASQVRAFLGGLEFPDLPEAGFLPEQLDRAAWLVANPAELKARYLSILTRFWDRFYRDQFRRYLPLMEWSVEYHRRQNYGRDLLAVFTAVTGRFPSEHHAHHLSQAERVVFVPSGLVGPYVTLNEFGGARPTLVVAYNCRPTAAPEQALSARDLFAPLKALADETRLQILSMLNGQELYAQQIVEHLGLSQPAVSSHLRLMVIGDVLRVRREGSMKYYSLNEETLATLADRLAGFRGRTSP